MDQHVTQMCSLGNIAEIKRLIKDGNMINIHANNYGMLNNACKDGNMDLVKLLIEYANSIDSPIDIHRYNEWMFRLACRSRNINLVKYLVKYSASIGSPIDMNICGHYVFNDACTSGDINLVKYLTTESGAMCRDEIIDEVTFINICEIGNMKLIKYLIGYANSVGLPIKIDVNCRFLATACMDNNVNFIEFLLEFDESINSPTDICERVFFKNACQNNNIDAVRYLIEYANSIGMPINIHACDEVIFREMVNKGSHDVARILVDESFLTDIKYLHDDVANTGFIFKEGLDPDDGDVYDFNGIVFESINGEPDYNFLEENIHRLVRKKSAR